jgi:aminopeptidase N
MLATQLEADYARRLLPVFDEPVFRCVFELSVRAPAGWEVLSNMPRVARRAGRGSVLHRFAPTPPMPSYLLALAVGHFDVLEGRVGGLPLRITTAPGKREQARFAMEATRQVLPFYAGYFGRPFALPKLDQIAVPGTRQGAMEDWGLISYVEDALLYDPALSGPDAQRGIFGIAAHEIAHQWFGNLVSVASWNEIWLNEAFATWMQQKASAQFHPEWQTALRVRRTLDATIARDATPATRAIRSGPVSEASVFEVFDDITYDKGGAVLTMLEQWVGRQAFQRGLSAYMAERGMKPATAGDLWHHLGRHAGLPVAEVAASWTDQPGVPLLELSAACESGQTVLGLRQSRFSMGEPLAGGPWQVPVRLARGDEQRTVLLAGEAQRVALPGCDDRPLLANAGGQGYYRVEYDAGLRARLAAAFPRLSPGDRVALLSDSFALASAGRRPMADHLGLLAALPQVHDAGRAPLYALALSQWRELDTAFDGTPAQAGLRRAGQALFGPELARLGWQPAPADDSETLSLRAQLIQHLAALHHAPTIAAARERFAAALDPAAGGVPPSLRGAVIAAVGAEASAAEFDALLAGLRASESQEERWVLVAGLSAGQDPAQARRLLDEALSGRLPQDISVALPGLVGEAPALSPLAYEFVLAHWDALMRLAGVGPFGGRHWLLPGAAGASSDPQLARRLPEDQRRLAGVAGASAAERVASAIVVRQRLRQREAEPFAAALAGWALP